MVSTDQTQALLRIARESIEHGVRHGGAATETREVLTGKLAAPGATFVTLYRQGALRGCVGSLEPRRSLGLDVHHNAYLAAFGDPRFPPLNARDMDDLALSVTLVGPLTPIAGGEESDLLAELRPGVDGLVLELGERRATFLPAVWEQLPGPRAFLEHLKHKAGLPRDFWSEGLRFRRYETVTLSDPPSAAA